MASVSFDDVAKVYPDGTRAVSGFDLDISDGESMVLVGQSGSGKTTALRMVAGLEESRRGEARPRAGAASSGEGGEAPRDAAGALEERRQAIQTALDSGETLATIGDVLSVSRQRVKQLREGK